MGFDLNYCFDLNSCYQLGVQTMEILEKLDTSAGFTVLAAVPLVKVKLEKLPVPFLSVSSMQSL